LSGGRCQRHCHRTWTLERDVRVCTRDPRRGNRWRLARGAIRRGCRRVFPHTTDTERGRTMVQVLQAGIHNAIRLLFVSRWRRGCIGEVCAGARGAAGWIHGNGAVPRRRSRISLSNSAPGWAAAAKRASSGRGRIRRGGGCETLTWYFVAGRLRVPATRKMAWGLACSNRPRNLDGTSKAGHERRDACLPVLGLGGRGPSIRPRAGICVDESIGSILTSFQVPGFTARSPLKLIRLLPISTPVLPLT
jgi:hypothetical protein